MVLLHSHNLQVINFYTEVRHVGGEIITQEYQKERQPYDEGEGRY